MMMNADELDRSEKLAIDNGDARTEAEATAIFARYVLQLEVRPNALQTAADEAAFATIINAAPRAFKGGVHVRLANDRVLEHGWLAGMRASEAVNLYGCRQISTLSDDHPTLILGPAPDRWPITGPCLQVTYTGWSGGVLARPHQSLPANTSTFPAAAVLAAAIGVGEAFQLVRENVQACRRDIGLSLWRPDLDWISPDSWGPPIRHWTIPSKLHLVGLGHLGQAYLWTLGWLPFQDRRAVELLLQDVDRVVKANLATSLLASADDLNEMKTRVLATRAERLGFQVRLLERKLDETQRVGVEDPQVALIGVDNPPARAMTGSVGWSLIIDGALGGRPDNYLDTHIHSFPSSRTPAEQWAGQHGTFDESLLNQPAYAEMEKRVGDHCGVIMVAGKAIGMAFAGAFASTLVIGELARYYSEDAERFEFVNASLRNLASRRVVINTANTDRRNHGYTLIG